MISWAGRTLVFLGVGHLLLALALTSSRHADSWFTADLWSPDEGVIHMSPAMAAFWLTTGSFSVPLVMIGLTVLWLDRRHIVPPSFIAWTLGVWSVVAAVILEPAPFVLASLAAGLLLAGARRATRTEPGTPAVRRLDPPPSGEASGQLLDSGPEPRGSRLWNRRTSANETR